LIGFGIVLMPDSESDNDSGSEDEEKLLEEIRGFEAQARLIGAGLSAAPFQLSI
jgi:hypothetical protein